MADKDKISEEAPKKQKETNAVAGNPPWPLITIGVFATVVILAMFVVIWLAVAAVVHDKQRDTAVDEPGWHMTRDNGRFGWHGRSSVGLGERAAQGVVTAINGDTVTVSGSGKQVTVKKTSSTVISGDKNDIAVNDTVVVFGDKADDGTVTAKRIVVRNEDFIEDSSSVGNDWMAVPSV